jgi:hypothetical protein
MPLVMRSKFEMLSFSVNVCAPDAQLAKLINVRVPDVAGLMVARSENPLRSEPVIVNDMLFPPPLPAMNTIVLPAPPGVYDALVVGEEPAHSGTSLTKVVMWRD